ncbi:MAG: peptide ABC transporter substrate-binding protein [Clostridiales bacterium]|nr:peptide ABC transporter substrate-binding protein [Clostridiales bacterium]
MKKLLSMALCLTLVLSAFAFGATAEGNSFRSLYSGEVTTLNYLTTATTNDFSLSSNIIDTLVEYDEYGQVQPSLAKEWKVSDDGLVWTFNLRDNATWVTYEGEYVANVTANDFVSAAKYLLNDKNASGTADVFYSVIAGAEDYYNSTIVPEGADAAPMDVDFATVGVKAVDDYTLVYTLSAPCPYFESMLTYVCFMPVYEPFLLEKGDQFGVANGPDTVLYCGAYLLKEFKPQEKRVLVKNAANWDADKVYIETIEYIYNKEASTISAEMYRRGEIDSASIDVTIANEWLANDETASLIRPVRQTGFYTYFYAFNFDPQFDAAYEPENWKKAANNEAFRKSIYYGLDRVKAMLITEPDNPESIMFNTVTPPDFVTLDGVDYTNIGSLAAISSLGSATFDEAKALEYKAQAIEELTAQGATFPIKILTKYNPGTSGWDAECQIVEQQLEALLGTDFIDIIVEAGPSTGFLTAVRRSGDYALLKCNWGPDYADPQTYTDPFDVGNNYNFMDKGANPAEMAEYYDLVKAAKAITGDTAARYEAFAKAEAYIIERAYIIPFGYGNGGYTASRVNPFTTQYAPFGISNYRYKGTKLVEEPMDTDAYFDAYDLWLEERAALSE